MFEEIPEVVPPVATEDNVEKKDTVNVVPPAIPAASEVASPIGGPSVTSPPAVPAVPAVPAAADIGTKTTRTRTEATIKRQILTNVMKTLTEVAANRFKSTNVYTPPSKEEITAECKKRWQDHLDRTNGKVKEDISMYF